MKGLQVIILELYIAEGVFGLDEIIGLQLIQNNKQQEINWLSV